MSGCLLSLTIELPDLCLSQMCLQAICLTARECPLQIVEGSHTSPHGKRHAFLFSWRALGRGRVCRSKLSIVVYKKPKSYKSLASTHFVSSMFATASLFFPINLSRSKSSPGTFSSHHSLSDTLTCKVRPIVPIVVSLLKKIIRPGSGI